MAEAILIKSGGGGTTSDDVTATRNDVLKGTTAITSDSDDDATDGTLELTGDALPENVLIGTTYYDTDAHTKKNGEMPNNGNLDAELLCGQSKTLPLGYTSGGIISVKSLAYHTSIDTDQLEATDPQILYGYQAWSNGVKRTGSMPHLTNNSTITHTSSNQTKVVLGDAVYVSTNSDGVVRAEIRYNGDNGYIASNTLIAVSQSDMASAAGLTASKIPSGQTVLGINGTYTSDGTASAGHILNGYIAYSKGTKLTGSMTNQGAVTSSLNCGGSYTIPAGYHNGSGKITANSLSSQTSADATASHIVSPYTAWVNGSKITGTIPSKAAQTYTPGTSNQTIASGYYLSGAQTIKGDSNLVAANIINGKTIFGVTGAFHGLVYKKGTATSNSSDGKKTFYMNYGTSSYRAQSLRYVQITPGCTPILVIITYLHQVTLASVDSSGNAYLNTTASNDYSGYYPPTDQAGHANTNIIATKDLIQFPLAISSTSSNISCDYIIVGY